MKKLHFIFAILFLPIIISAQSTNSWIDFDKNYYKLKVAENGIYRVTFDELETNGFPINSTNGSSLKLISQGEEVAIFTSNDNQWASGDYFEFYGEKLDGSFDTQLFEAPEDQLHTFMSLYSDTSAYFLTINETASNLRIEEFTNDLTNTPSPEPYFMHQSIVYNNQSFFNGIGENLIYDNIDYIMNVNAYSSEFQEGEGFVGDVFATNVPNISNERTKNVYTPNIAIDGPEAEISVKVVAQSDVDTLYQDHILYIGVNDNELVLDVFDGFAVNQYDLDNIPLNYLSEPNSEFQFAALSNNTDRNAISYITVKYPRLFNFEEVEELAFSIENNTAGNYIEFDNLAIDEDWVLIDLTNHLKVPLNYNGNIHQAMLPAGIESTRNLLLQNITNYEEITLIETAAFIDYTDVLNQGNYIIISHPQVMNDGNAVQNYMNYRSSTAGGAYQVTLANVEQLYNQYAYGINKHPLAIKHFLDDAITNWQNNPSHCLLLAKAIKNSKCRNNPITWPKNLLPTFGDGASDQIFGSSTYEPLSRIAIGRISATNGEQVQNYLDKITIMEQELTSSPCNYYEEELWRHKTFSVGGGGSILQKTAIAERLLQQADIAANGVYSNQTEYFVNQAATAGIEQDCGPNVSVIECITNAFENGIGTVNFIGHANGLYWEINLGDFSNFDFNNRFPVMYAQADFIGDIYKDFGEPGTLSMSEDWTMAAEKGAIAYIAQTQFGDFTYTPDLYDEIFYQRHNNLSNETLGEQFRIALHNVYNNATGINDEYAANTVTFSGDPAYKLKKAQQPDILFTEEDINLQVETIGNYYHNIDLEFSYSSVNVPINESQAYVLIAESNNVIDTLLAGTLSQGETISWSNALTLLTSQQTTFSLIIDASNAYDELCEDNNSFTWQLPNNTVSIEGDIETNKLTVYPNPFNEFTSFALANPIANSIIEITDLTGKKLSTLKTNNQKQVDWNGTDAKGNTLANGVYIYQLRDNKGKALSAPNKISLLR